MVEVLQWWLVSAPCTAVPSCRSFSLLVGFCTFLSLFVSLSAFAFPSVPVPNTPSHLLCRPYFRPFFFGLSMFDLVLPSGGAQAALVRRQRVHLRRGQGPQGTPPPHQRVARHHPSQGVDDAPGVGDGMGVEVGSRVDGKGARSR